MASRHVEGPGRSVCPCGCDGVVPAGKRFAGKGCGPRLALKGRARGIPAPEPVLPPDWWETAPREGFMAEVRRRYDVVSESTFGVYVGRKPTAVLQPNGWESQFDV